MHSHRGAGMVDVIVALLLLAVAGVVFSATFPAGFSAVRQAGETKKAVALAQQKLEEVKALGYESLAYTNLRSANAIDAEPTGSPYAFTSVDNLSSSLAAATGTLTIEDYDQGIKRVTVAVRWEGGAINRTVTLRTLIADTRPWRNP
jgi:type II secretory pathway pseudopilin PulG